jgi:hypothetical protein
MQKTYFIKNHAFPAQANLSALSIGVSLE